MMASRRVSHFGLRRVSAFACAFTDDDATGDWGGRRAFREVGHDLDAGDDTPGRRA